MKNQFILFLVLLITLVCFPRAVAQTPTVSEPSRKSVKSKKITVAAKPIRNVSSQPKMATNNDLLGLSVTERKIVHLLERSPFVDPQPTDALTGEEFLIAASEFGIPASEKGNPLDALKALEAKIQRVGPVNAVVSSTPTSLSVQYRRITDSNLTFNTLTNSTITLDPPATYIFTCTGPGGTTQTQKKYCAGGCTVTFSF